MPKYELSIEIDLPEDFGSFQELELKIVEASREAGRSLLGKILVDFEKIALGKRAVQKKDRRMKSFETLLGVIPFERWRVWDVFKKKCVYPVDEWMGLSARQKVSPGLVSEIVEQCVQRPYAQASKICKKLSGVKRSVVGNWNLVQKFAGKEKEKMKEKENLVPNWREKSLPVLVSQECDPCPILGVDPDATYVRPRRKTDTNHEIKMAVLYTGRKKQGKNRWALDQKQVVISPVKASVKEFFNTVTQKAVADYGLHAQTRVPSHGDGDPWLKRFTEYCPQALLRLDPYHVFKKIREATDVETLPKDWIKDFYTNPRSLIHKIKKLGLEMAEKQDKERIEKLVNYLQNNIEGMKPSGVPRSIKSKYPRMYLRGSGTIESNIFQGICQRFKGPRMMWSKDGLNNLSFLRQNYLNKTFSFKKPQIPKGTFSRIDYEQELREVVRAL